MSQAMIEITTIPFEDGRERGGWSWFSNAIFDVEVSAYAKLAYLALARFADGAGSCFPSVGTLARVMGCGRTRVKESLGELEQAGLVDVEPRTHNSNLYILRCPSKHDPPVATRPPGRHATDHRSPRDLPQSPRDHQLDLPNKTHGRREKPELPQPPSASEGTLSFTNFFEAYPRKRKREEAYAEWRKLSPNASLRRAIMSTLEVDKRTVDWQRYAFIPYPATWLRRRRWEDPTGVLGDE